MPGEAENAAKLLGMTLQDFFDKHLGVDFYIDDGDAIFVLAPALTNMDGGEMYPFNPLGTCTFLSKSERCGIHTESPHECQMYYHTDNKAKTDKRHKSIAMAWKDHQNQIEELLGYKPTMPEPTFSELFGLFL